MVDRAQPGARRPVAAHLRQRPAAVEVRGRVAQPGEAGRLHRGDHRPLEQPALAQRGHDLVLAASHLEVEVEADPVERRGGQRVERLGQGERLAARRVGPVVRDQQRAAGAARAAAGTAPILGEVEVAAWAEDVQLDRVDPGLDRGREAGERVAGGERVGALVTDAQHRGTVAPASRARLVERLGAVSDQAVGTIAAASIGHVSVGPDLRGPRS